MIHNILHIHFKSSFDQDYKVQLFQPNLKKLKKIARALKNNIHVQKQQKNFEVSKTLSTCKLKKQSKISTPKKKSNIILLEDDNSIGKMSSPSTIKKINNISIFSTAIGSSQLDKNNFNNVSLKNKLIKVYQNQISGTIGTTHIKIDDYDNGYNQESNIGGNIVKVRIRSRTPSAIVSDKKQKKQVIKNGIKISYSRLLREGIIYRDRYI